MEDFEANFQKRGAIELLAILAMAERFVLPREIHFLVVLRLLASMIKVHGRPVDTVTLKAGRAVTGKKTEFDDATDFLQRLILKVWAAQMLKCLPDWRLVRRKGGGRSKPSLHLFERSHFRDWCAAGSLSAPALPLESSAADATVSNADEQLSFGSKVGLVGCSTEVHDSSIGPDEPPLRETLPQSLERASGGVTASLDSQSCADEPPMGATLRAREVEAEGRASGSRRRSMQRRTHLRCDRARGREWRRRRKSPRLRERSPDRGSASNADSNQGSSTGADPGERDASGTSRGQPNGSPAAGQLDSSCSARSSEPWQDAMLLILLARLARKSDVALAAVAFVMLGVLGTMTVSVVAFAQRPLELPVVHLDVPQEQTYRILFWGPDQLVLAAQSVFSGLN